MYGKTDFQSSRTGIGERIVEPVKGDAGGRGVQALDGAIGSALALLFEASMSTSLTERRGVEADEDGVGHQASPPGCEVWKPSPKGLTFSAFGSSSSIFARAARVTAYWSTKVSSCFSARVFKGS